MTATEALNKLKIIIEQTNNESQSIRAFAFKQGFYGAAKIMANKIHAREDVIYCIDMMLKEEAKNERI